MLPVDWCCTSDTAAQRKAKAAIEDDNERMFEEFRRREAMTRGELPYDGADDASFGGRSSDRPSDLATP